MSRMLNLSQHLLVRGRRYLAVGADQQAAGIFARLAHLRDLPPDIAENTQFHLAELLLKQRRFTKARRHLTAALTHDAANPEYHYLLACTHAEDAKGDHKVAMRHFRFSIKHEPENPYYHLHGGLFAANHGELALGLKWLRRAAELAADDPEVIGAVVDCLQQLGQLDEAREIARSALFRNSRDRRFQQLWNDMRFQEVHLGQQQVQKRRQVRRAVSEGPVRLQFLKLTVETATGRKLVRRDGPANLPTPHFHRLADVRDNKHA